MWLNYKDKQVNLSTENARGSGLFVICIFNNIKAFFLNVVL